MNSLSPFLRRNIITLIVCGAVIVFYLIFFSMASDCGSCSKVESYRPAPGTHYNSGSNFNHK